MYQAFYAAKETFRSVNASFSGSESTVSFQWLLWEDISVTTRQIQDHCFLEEEIWILQALKTPTSFWFQPSYVSPKTLRKAE